MYPRLLLLELVLFYNDFKLWFFIARIGVLSLSLSCLGRTNKSIKLTGSLSESFFAAVAVVLFNTVQNTV
jgi:hypothetical protein